MVCDRKVREINEKSLKATVKEHDIKIFKIETENRQFQTDLVSQTEEFEKKINATEENILNDLGHNQGNLLKGIDNKIVRK